MPTGKGAEDAKEDKKDNEDGQVEILRLSSVLQVYTMDMLSRAISAAVRSN